MPKRLISKEAPSVVPSVAKPSLACIVTKGFVVLTAVKDPTVTGFAVFAAATVIVCSTVATPPLRSETISFAVIVPAVV